MIGIYIHIPFCNSICTYCDFCKMMAKEEVKEEYVKKLIEEINLAKINPLDVDTVYIGGGTPNSLNISLLEEIFKAIEPYLINSKENTIEINPELFSIDEAKLFNKYHFNRVSIGVQTLNESLLKKIARMHTKKDIIFTIDALNKYGITNINVDMMCGLPSQTLGDLENDIEEILKLNLTHISYYSLILEEKTILDYQIKHNQITLPDDDLVADMETFLAQKLENDGFRHYEISNYAKKGYESKHNLKYWNVDEYIGFGLKAASYYKGFRTTNSSKLSAYYQKKDIEITKIDLNEAKKEFMMLGLRKLEGIRISTYYAKFSSYPTDDFNLDKYIKMGLLEVDNDIIRLKKNMFLLANLVFLEFV